MVFSTFVVKNAPKKTAPGIIARGWGEFVRRYASGLRFHAGKTDPNRLGNYHHKNKSKLVKVEHAAQVSLKVRHGPFGHTGSVKLFQ